MTLLYDKASISGKGRITREGYFVADALVAKANNIQPYLARELGLTDRDPNDVVRVFRPESEVFAADSVATATKLPITLDHPPVMVDARNWRTYTRGETGDDVMRDGDLLRVPLRVTDAEAVQSVLDDRQEFSLGYDCNVQFTPGNYQGAAYDAIATDIRYNHLAACRTARGGPQLRIVDERTPDGGTPMPHIVMVDGLPVDVANVETAATVVKNAIAGRDTAVGALDEATRTVAARDATIAGKDGEISTLRDQLAAAKLSPAALRDAAARYVRVVEKAKALGATVTDTMDEQAVVAAAVKHKMADRAAGYTTPEQFAAAFDALEVPGGYTPAQPRDALGDVLGNLQVTDTDLSAAVKARDARMARFGTAYLNAPRSAAN